MPVEMVLAVGQAVYRAGVETGVAVVAPAQGLEVTYDWDIGPAFNRGPITWRRSA